MTMTLGNVAAGSGLEIPRLELTEGELKFYRAQGYLQIPGLLPQEVARTLHGEVMSIMHAIGGFEGNKLKQTSDHLAGTPLEAFINNERIRAVAEQLVGGPASLYLPFTAVKGSGGGQFHFHQDNNYTFYEDGMGGVNLWFALCDMTPENGCLQIAPRSHLQGQVESVNAGDGDFHRKVAMEVTDFLPIRMRAGDAVAFSRLTIHGSGANRTPTPRVGYALQFYRNDVYFLDGKTGERRLLRDHSPQAARTKPVAFISVPKEKVDGH